MKILVVEDDPLAQRILTHLLEMMVHTVTTCNNGQEALEVFQQDPAGYSVIISDWLMPELNGLELCQKVRSIPKEDYTYFILLSVKEDNKENKMQAMEAGVDDFISKPIDRDQLWMCLHVAQRILRYTKQITQLEQLLPICMYCHKIRDDKNYWEKVETYIHQKLGTDFSHSICPECYTTVVVPQMQALKEKQKAS